MRHSSAIVAASGVLLLIAGLALPWWVLSFAGVLVFATLGSPIVALFCALLLDLFFGPPTGFLHMLVLPVVVCVVCILLCRSFITRHLRDTSVY